MNMKISMFVICVEVIMYLLLYNLHDYTFNGHLSEASVIDSKYIKMTGTQDFY